MKPPRIPGRRWFWLLGLWVLAGLWGCGQDPSLVFGDDTPADLRDLGLGVWEEFTEVFPDQSDCIGEVRLEGDWDLAGARAFYLPEERTIVLRIPATAAHLRHSLIHELAHHLEHWCSDHSSLRADFLEAQGLSSDTSWFVGPSWEETPSEQFAEAVVRLVLGRPVMNYRISLRPEAIEVVKEWGGAG